MFNRILNAIKDNKRVIYLAPSRELIECVRNKGLQNLGALYNIDVITFDDLSRQIAKSFLKDKEVIPYETSLVVIEDVLKKLHENKKIKYFDMVYDKRGFAVNALNAIRGLKKENIDFQLFLKKVENIDDDVINKKSLDLYEIYKAYEERLDELNLIDMDDIIKIAIENVDKTDSFKNASMFVVDGYLDIFKSEEALLKKIKETYNMEYIYHLPLNVPYVFSFAEGEILKFAHENNFEIVKDDFIDDGKYKQIAKVLFTPDVAERQDIKIIDAPCIEDEVRQVAAKIKEIYKNEKTMLDNIAIILSDRQEYEDKLIEIFNEYKIYLSISDTEKLSNIPFIKTLMSFLRLKNERYNKELLEDILTSPYIKIENKEEALYILNNSYKEDKTIEYIEKLSQENEKIKECKEAYKEFNEKIEKALGQFKQRAKFEEYKDSLIKLIDSISIKKNIIEMQNENKISFEIMVRDLKALFGFINMLNDLEGVYKYQEDEINFTDFLAILDESLRETTVTLKQKPSYGVRVLTPDVLRGTSYDYVFIMGLNEGKFPKISKMSGIYTSREKEMLTKIGINLGSSQFEMTKEKVRFILSVASCKKDLYISYRTSNEDGSYISRSQFLDELLYKLNIKVKDKKLRTMRDRFSINDVFSKDEALKRYCLNEDSNLEDILNNIAQSELIKVNFAKEIEQKRNGETYTEYDGYVDKDILDKIFNDEKYSASRVMTYNRCPFKYLLENGLKLKEWEDDIFSKINTGNIFHEILEHYFGKLVGQSLVYDKEKIESIANHAFNKFGLVLDDIVTEETKKIILDTIKVFIEKDVEFKNKINFRPYLIEQPFKIKDLIEGSEIVGRIDRVDMEYDGDVPTGRYIIHDYKISNAKGLTDILKGETIQIALYYYAVEEILKSKGISPQCIAMVYYDIAKTLEKNKPQFAGIVIDENKKILGLDGRSNTVLDENIDIVLKHINKNFIENSINGIKNGVFTLPKVCSYLGGFGISCDFEDVCRYDSARIARKSEVIK
ncbi:MAG: exodeoxyribonuclease V subunit gamma [Clostridiales bacterium]|nr:exodeoxyribonuclease V subunit gamma [Clostridiales bacterium]